MIAFIAVARMFSIRRRVRRLVVVSDIADGADRHPDVPEDEHRQQEKDQKLPERHDGYVGGRISPANKKARGLRFLLTQTTNVYTSSIHKVAFRAAGGG